MFTHKAAHKATSMAPRKSTRRWRTLALAAGLLCGVLAVLSLGARVWAAAGADFLEQNQTYTLRDPIGSSGSPSDSVPTTQLVIRTYGGTVTKTFEDPWYSVELAYRWARGWQFSRGGEAIFGDVLSYGLWSLGALTLTSSQTAKFQLAAAMRTSFTWVDGHRFKTMDYLVGLRTLAINGFGGFSRTFVSAGPSRNDVSGPRWNQIARGWRLLADSSVEMPVTILGMGGFFVKADVSSGWLLGAADRSQGQAVRFENSYYDSGIGLGLRF